MGSVFTRNFFLLALIPDRLLVSSNRLNCQFSVYSVYLDRIKSKFPQHHLHVQNAQPFVSLLQRQIGVILRRVLCEQFIPHTAGDIVVFRCVNRVVEQVHCYLSLFAVDSVHTSYRISQFLQAFLDFSDG